MWAAAVMAGVMGVMSKHTHRYQAKTKLQQDGGSIGNVLTGEVADAVMAWWKGDLLTLAGGGPAGGGGQQDHPRDEQDGQQHRAGPADHVRLPGPAGGRQDATARPADLGGEGGEGGEVGVGGAVRVLPQTLAP